MSGNISQPQFEEFVPDPAREAACKARLREYLISIGQRWVDDNVEHLTSLESGVRDRFNYFAPRMPEGTRMRLLVSGCAVGSEMIIARRYGFREIVGTEVAREYAEMAQLRLGGDDGFGVVLYEGLQLPFRDETFSSVVSGHIIEHTPSPYEYLREHVRVLAPGGFLFLEFPNRYHYKELHTRLPSLEYLPMPLRSLGLRYCASRFSLFSKDERKRYDDIRRTLQPVSVWQIKSYLSRMGYQGCRVVHHYAPARGFMRMLISK
jgi:SAM-dependent methyltransferase